MKHLAIILAILCTTSQADEWTGQDKAKHFSIHVATGEATRAMFPALTDT